jgi:hypothetical protein
MDRVCSIAAFCFHRVPFLQILLAAAFGAGASFASSPVLAGSPDVSFDVTPSVGCRDVTTAEFADANPDERLVEAQIEVSSLIRQGNEGDLLQYFYRFDSPRQTLRIVDYLPKTTLASDLAGNVTIEKKQESTKGLGATVTAPFEWPVKLAGSGELATKTLDSTRYELVPPMTAVAASGTLDRGYSVYFKLKPSRSTSLEGAKHFAMVFRVPHNWRADYVHLSCTASATVQGLLGPLDEPFVCGRRKFVVALYAEGDASAKAAAERLVRAESELLKSLSANRKELERRFYPTVVHRVGAMFEGVSASLPENVAEAIVYGGQTPDRQMLELRLPAEVRQAVAKYSVARRALSSLRAAETSGVQ